MNGSVSDGLSRLKALQSMSGVFQQTLYGMPDPGVCDASYTSMSNGN
jgi:hypothetical protein